MKSNINHLRDICADNEEALEFIEAIEEEIKDLKDDLEEELNELEEREPNFATINTGIGTFHWQADNLLLQQIAVALEPALKRNPNAVLAALEALR